MTRQTGKNYCGYAYCELKKIDIDKVKVVKDKENQRVYYNGVLVAGLNMRDGMWGCTDFFKFIKEKWILYFSKKGQEFDKLINLTKEQETLWKQDGYLIEFEDDDNCEDYMDYEGTLDEAKSYADSFRNKNGVYIIK